MNYDSIIRKSKLEYNMTEISSQPHSPSEWKEYADLDAVASIPLREAQAVDDQTGIAIFRGVYLDGSSLLKTTASRIYIYADVLALTELETVLTPPANATIQIVARVLTADGPVHLKFNQSSGSCVISLYASIVDQPISVSAAGSNLTTLELGSGTGNVGVVAGFTSGSVIIEYQKRYFIDTHADFQLLLQTQLRVALALFWRNISISVSLCAHVATVTVLPQQYPLINAQAVALGQQLSARAMTGSDASYAPVLKISEYLNTMDSALDALSAFEAQYNRFLDKGQSLQDQMLAWDTMLQKAIDEKSMRENLRNTARTKYDSAREIASNCSFQMVIDNGEVNDARVAFEVGLEKWKFEQTMKAVFSILTAIIDFAAGIGTICLGDPNTGAGAAVEVAQAVKTVQEAEQIAGQVNKVLTSGTLEKLGSCMSALEKLYPLVDAIVNAVQGTESDPNATIPPTNNISGSSQGDADAATIVALAAWDKWVLESDQQMDVAVSLGIEGASDYRLALRKNAIDGKQLAQAQAEAVKAGQQYVQAQMEVILCQQDIQSLQDLHDKYQGEADIYAEAQAKFYDRFMGLRISLSIEMQNIVWAYKYYTLEDSSVVLDSQKSGADYKQDIATIKLEMENVESQYASDFQLFTYDIPSDQLPSNYHQVLINGLKSPDHTASFTLAPKAEGDNTPSFASQFVDGSHYRLDGVEATLRGAKAVPGQVQNGVVIVVLQLSTSGVYSDINQGKVLSFASLPQSKRFSYDLKESGEIGETRDHAIYETSQHAEPTPFTQWTIKLLYPERVNLDNLTAVDFEWTGHVRFDPARKAKA
ncbi:hypothetical protein F5B22DRAFT_506471 [Xylaria bambusicola]|uniref:uncharacterized protein n=1 Tax=Xylaria bambusicola TaxID=326684 RepID=UPI002007814A|nr:uncharacterized protein F5B22DRAFT_506471 [Xylaria bambusicola]KAI0521854.1 hypothetical protein F5B22DRAFT_506471 [Xylaria bambusicola]